MNHPPYFSRSCHWVGIALLILAPLALGACQPAADQQLEFAEEGVEPVPEEIVQRMATFLAGQDRYEFRARVMFQAMQEWGQKLQFERTETVIVDEPDRMFWATWRDDGSADSAWFDRGTFSMVRRPDNFYGQIEAPPTIDELIVFLSDEYNVNVPFRDLVATSTEQNMMGRIASPVYVGPSWIDGVLTDHLAFSTDEVDWEVWVQRGARPVPRKLALIWKNEEGLPGFVARFTEWDLSPRFSDSMFEFTPPPDVERIDVVPSPISDDEI